MSVTVTLDDEIDISRGDMLASASGAESWASPSIGQRFRADVVWMDERPLDPARLYFLKQTTRTVRAELDHGLVLNQIGSVTISTARPVIFDRYAENRGTGSFVLIDPTTNFTAGAGMIAEGIRDRGAVTGARPSAAEKLARLARSAGSDADAIEAVRKALEELLH
jgi:sulfate adenylyltransferase subunit 1 (EFTu-like GTPase family)